jgi:hypothetical protein
VLSIHVDFVRGLTGAQLREAYEASVRANAGDDLAGYRASLDALLGTMRDVRAGDSYTFIAEPGAGLWVQHNGDLVASIEDDEFARLFVRLYVGDQPPTEAVRDGLLGLRR